MHQSLWERGPGAEVEISGSRSPVARSAIRYTRHRLVSYARCRSSIINIEPQTPSETEYYTIFNLSLSFFIVSMMSRIAPTRIVNKPIGPVGYGMLGLSVPWAPIEHDVAAGLLKRALDSGANLWNTVY
jgi:hypothetical protein